MFFRFITLDASRDLLFVPAPHPLIALADLRPAFRLWLHPGSTHLDEIHAKCHAFRLCVTRWHSSEALLAGLAGHTLLYV